MAISKIAIWDSWDRLAGKGLCVRVCAGAGGELTSERVYVCRLSYLSLLVMRESIYLYLLGTARQNHGTAPLSHAVPRCPIRQRPR
jgi:hypothetical protein